MQDSADSSEKSIANRQLRVTNDVWIKTAADSWTGKGFSWNVPNDGNWYHVLSEAWSAQVSDDDVSIWINNNGYPLDLDVVWVSSGI